MFFYAYITCIWMYGDVVWKNTEEKMNGLKCMPHVLYEYCSPPFTNFHCRGVATSVIFPKLNGESQVEIVFSRQKKLRQVR